MLNLKKKLYLCEIITINFLDMIKSIFFALCFFISVTACTQQASENWTQFRGPNGQGISTATGLPITWSTTDNVAWKTPIPGEGWSSPIVWNEHIFVTTATNEGRNCHVIAVNRRTGAVLWDKLVFTQEPNQRRHPMNSYSTPTPVTDGETVYSVFSDGSIIALDFNGNVKWVNRDLDFYSQHGKGTSPILYNDLLIIAVNHSNREEPLRMGWQLPWEHSFLLAIDKNTGRERWRGTRGMSRIAHSTPVIMEVNGRDQIISVAGDVIQGFDPSNGRLIWTANSDGEPCVPTPSIGNGMVFSSPHGGAAIRAVRANGQGDVTETHIAWQGARNSPMMSSFLFIEPYLYMATNSNNFICLNADTGEQIWQVQLDIGGINPSPLYADGKIYVLSESGVTAVLKLQADLTKPAEIIATNRLDSEEYHRASMAVAGKQLIIRSANHLWCIGK